MMTMNKYFFDSYAILEMLKSSENYSIFSECEFIITKLNLFEVFFRVLQDSEEKAKFVLSNISDKVVDFDETVIEESCKLKLAKRKLSMADCIGYTVAMKSGLKFLTGDKEFENMPNVEFVK